jgi:hypothetical protein
MTSWAYVQRSPRIGLKVLPSGSAFRPVPASDKETTDSGAASSGRLWLQLVEPLGTDRLVTFALLVRGWAIVVTPISSYRVTTF